MLFGTAVFLTIIASRWLNIPNFNPVLSLAVIGGALIPTRKYAILIPLTALFLADLGLALQSADNSYLLYITTGGFLLNYLFYFISVLAGRKISNNFSLKNSLTATFLTASIFFIGSNLVTFFTTDIYPHHLSGLLTCYTAAIPFFGASLVSNLMVAAIVPIALKNRQLSRA